MTKKVLAIWKFEFRICLEFRPPAGGSIFGFLLKLVEFKESGEEGGDDVKSAWCLCPGRHTSYNGE